MNSIKSVSSDQRTLARIHCNLLTFSYQMLLILSLAAKTMVTSMDCSKPPPGLVWKLQKGSQWRMDSEPKGTFLPEDLLVYTCRQVRQL